MEQFCVVILAGGLGSRMSDGLPKVLRKVNAQSMIVCLINEVIKMNPHQILVVVGKFKNQIKSEIDRCCLSDAIQYVDQLHPLGTADAIKCTLDKLHLNKPNLILNADMPLLKMDTMSEVCQHYLLSNNPLLIATIHLENPTNNGRIVQNKAGVCLRIVEQKDCTKIEQHIKLVNAGIYVCSTACLLTYIPLINNHNVANEYYLTDLVKVCHNDGIAIALFTLSKDKVAQIRNVNTPEDLAWVNHQC